MQEQQKQLVDRLKQAQNILVTVSKNPSVDQLSAAIGLTLVLNHLDKHATAVFSGKVPNTLEFLKPEDILEKNTDSLRDFIIALDKSKADKLRYKVEDEVVRIFITPYKTSISEKDLDFSQGDFNVDVVVALGVTDPQDLDEAITAHGRILHDATVASVNLGGESKVGSIVWSDSSASSLSELIADLSDALDKKIVDSQIATALLTGIVSATERFRNDKTSPKAMTVSSALMAAGANQQLIVTELEAPANQQPEDENNGDDSSESSDSSSEDNSDESTEEPKSEPGTLEIEHGGDHESEYEGDEQDSFVPPAAEPLPEEPARPQVQVDEEGYLSAPNGEQLPEISRVHGVSNQSVSTAPQPEENHDEPFGQPEHGSEPATSNFSEDADTATENLTLPGQDTPVLNHDNAQPEQPAEQPFVPLVPESPETPPEPEVIHPDVPAEQPANKPSQPPANQAGASFAPPSPDVESVVTPDETLHQIEEAVESQHLETEPPVVEHQSVDSIRDAVEAAYQNGADSGKPPLDLNALPLGNELHEAVAEEEPAAPAPKVQSSQPAPFNAGFSEPTPGNSPADQTLDMPLPQNVFGNIASANNQFIPAPQSTTFQTPQTTDTAPTAFPGLPSAPAPSDDTSGMPPPPPVPPPMLPPLQ